MIHISNIIDIIEKDDYKVDIILLLRIGDEIPYAYTYNPSDDGTPKTVTKGCIFIGYSNKLSLLYKLIEV